MLYRDKKTGKIVKVIERLPEKADGTDEHDRVFFESADIVTKYVYAFQWENDFEVVNDGDICRCCGAVIESKA